MSIRKLIFSVGIKDCKVDVMRSSKGAGGQHRDKTSSAVRITHEPSGATGFSQDQREQPRNKRIAFKRMAESKQFQSWAQEHGRGLRPLDEVVDDLMTPENIKVEVKAKGTWTDE